MNLNMNNMNLKYIFQKSNIIMSENMEKIYIISLFVHLKFSPELKALQSFE